MSNPGGKPYLNHGQQYDIKQSKTKSR